MRDTITVIALVATALSATFGARVTVFAQQGNASGTTTSAAASTTASAQQATTAASAQGKTQWDGIYTEDQAKRGEPLYVQYCGSCHGAELAGTDKGPPLVGSDFSRTWNNTALAELSERMRTTMPSDKPGSLTRRQNADILAFMLLKGNAPAGQTELPTQVDALQAIKYTAQKPAN